MLNLAAVSAGSYFSKYYHNVHSHYTKLLWGNLTVAPVLFQLTVLFMLSEAMLDYSCQVRCCTTLGQLLILKVLVIKHRISTLPFK